MRRPAVAVLVCLLGTVGASAFVLSGGSGSESTGSTVTLRPVAASASVHPSGGTADLTAAPPKLTPHESLLQTLQQFLRNRGPLAPVARSRSIVPVRSVTPPKSLPLVPDSGMACPVAGGGGCSIVPCAEYAGGAVTAVAAVATPVMGSVAGSAVGVIPHPTLASPVPTTPNAARPKKCLPRPGTPAHPYRVSAESR